ncbi:metalloregulator ArsR/SmtB family transcription factor [Desulfovibrio sp. OttesenSCG-928-A18]|nr:metalloregulator ArsR/SmtB family transcription factor [Desulfovibrio sp. OttesenSCG-928-A18]
MRTEFIGTLPEDWKPAAEVFAALGDTLRQKILLLFEPQEELSIKDIAEVFPLSRTAIVHHLGVLERAGIVQSRREGKAALYSLRVQPVLEALEALRGYIFEEFPETRHSGAPALDGHALDMTEGSARG